MDMVERIARLISEQDRIEAGEASDFVDWHWEERAELAAEILRTMREPTDEMIRACSAITLDHARRVHSSSIDWAAGWRAMIGAALANGPMTAPTPAHGNPSA